MVFFKPKNKFLIRFGNDYNMFVIDFDDTLFDTQKFKDSLNKTLIDCGVSLVDADWSYQLARNLPDGQFAYSHVRRAEFLATRGYDQNLIVTALEKVMANESLLLHLLPGVHEFLQTLKDLGKQLILLSLGDPNFQELKVQGTGIAYYFDRLFMVPDKKEAVIAELLAHHSPTEYWLVNDKVNETLNIKKSFPDIRVVLKHSPQIALAEYEKSGESHFETLAEIQTYILETYGK